MYQSEIKLENPEEKRRKVKKPFAHLPITTPWKYKVPLNSYSDKNKLKHIHNGSIKNGCKSIKNNIGNFERQYIFSRLMYLFPGVHPANVHGILLNCNYDIYLAADKIKRSIKFLEPYRPNINNYGNVPSISHLKYCAPQTMAKINNGYYNCCNRHSQQLRNYLNPPMYFNKPNYMCMVPTNCYNTKNRYIKYDSSKNVYSQIL